MAKGPKQSEMKLSQVAKRVIPLARKIHDYYEAELPKRHRQYPIIASDEEGPPPPAEEKTLGKLLRELPRDLLYQLLLLMYLGREQIGVDELAKTYAELKQSVAEPDWAVTLMLNKACLADYLSHALEQLQSHGIDVDHLPLQGGVASS